MTAIPGLIYLPGVIPEEFQIRLVQILQSSNDWVFTGSLQNSRRVIQYGFKYNYMNGSVNEKTVPFPAFVDELADIITSFGIVKSRLNQCLINIYEVGQGITSHIDTDKYAEFICGFTLANGANLIFTRPGYSEVKLYTEPGSLYIMSGESRYLWKHEIRPTVDDVVNGVKIPRGVRISVTFRTVL